MTKNDAATNLVSHVLRRYMEQTVREVFKSAPPDDEFTTAMRSDWLRTIWDSLGKNADWGEVAVSLAEAIPEEGGTE